MNYSGTEIISVILELFGLVAIVAAGVKGIIYLLTPYRQTKQKIEEHEKRLDEHEQYLKNDKEKLEALTQLSKDSLRLQLAMVNHAIDGNGIETMKRVREEIQNEIFDMKEL